MVIYMNHFYLLMKENVALRAVTHIGSLFYFDI